MTRAVASATAQVETMDHHLLVVDTAAKPRIVAEIAARDGRTILFVRTKHGVDRLVKTLRREGVVAGALHGGKAQNARNRAIAEFKEGRTPVLVATDVAARGIHIDDVSLVVHVDPPADPKDYLHRAGRGAGRRSGTVVTMVTQPERREVDRLTRLAGVRATSTEVRPGDPALAGSPDPRRAVCRWRRRRSLRPPAPPPGRRHPRPRTLRGRSSGAPRGRRAAWLSASARAPFRSCGKGLFARPDYRGRTGQLRPSTDSASRAAAPPSVSATASAAGTSRFADSAVVTAAVADGEPSDPRGGRRVQPLQPGRGAVEGVGLEVPRLRPRSISSSRSTGGG